jgi:hypothetical protein
VSSHDVSGLYTACSRRLAVPSRLTLAFSSLDTFAWRVLNWCAF